MSLHVAGCLYARYHGVAAVTKDERMHAGERCADRPRELQLSRPPLSGDRRCAMSAQAVQKFHYHLQRTREKELISLFPVMARVPRAVNDAREPGCRERLHARNRGMLGMYRCKQAGRNSVNTDRREKRLRLRRESAEELASSRTPIRA